MPGKRHRARTLRRTTVVVTATIVALLVAASSALAAGPTVTIDQAAGQSDPTSGASIQFTAVFSAAVTGFNNADVALTGSTAAGTLAVTVTGGPSVYTVTVTGMIGPGTVETSIPAGAAQDAGSNSSAASTSTDNSVTWYLDTEPPTVTIDAAPGQADPASTAPILFIATFSEPVTDFTAADVVLAGSSAGGELTTTVEGGPTLYRVAVSGMAGAGNVIATIRPGAALDLAGNPSLASTSTDNSVAWLPSSPAGASPTPILAQRSATPSLRVLSPCHPKHPCMTDRHGRVLPLRVACATTAPCTGTLTIALGHKTLGKLHFHLAAGSHAEPRVPLTRRATHLLTTRPKITAKLNVTLGATSTSQRLSFALPPAG